MFRFYYKLIKIKKIIMGIQDVTRVIVQCEFEVFGHVQGVQILIKKIFSNFSQVFNSFYLFRIVLYKILSRLMYWKWNSWLGKKFKKRNNSRKDARTKSTNWQYVRYFIFLWITKRSKIEYLTFNRLRFIWIQSLTIVY